MTLRASLGIPLLALLLSLSRIVKCDEPNKNDLELPSNNNLVVIANEPTDTNLPTSNTEPSKPNIKLETHYVQRSTEQGVITERVTVPVYRASDGNYYSNFMPLIYKDTDGLMKAITDFREVKEEHIDAMKSYLENVQKAKNDLSSAESDGPTKEKAKAALVEYLTFVSDLELDQRDEALKKSEAKVAKLRAQLELNRKSQVEMISMQIRMLEMAAEGVSLPEPWQKFLKPSVLTTPATPYVVQQPYVPLSNPSYPPTHDYAPQISTLDYAQPIQVFNGNAIRPVTPPGYLVNPPSPVMPLAPSPATASPRPSRGAEKK